MDFELVTEGLKFPEGPIAMADGSVVLVEIQRQTLSRVRPDGRIEVIADLGGGPNGAAVGPDGAVYVCNNGGFEWAEAGGLTTPHGTPADYKSGSIQRVDLAGGTVTTVYDACDGRPLRGPNDIVFDAAGGFWFTDLGKSDGDRMHMGHLLYAKADGSMIRRVREGMITPNGVGLSPDGKTVWVCETHTSRVWGFGVVGPGEIEQPPNLWTPGAVLGAAARLPAPGQPGRRGLGQGLLRHPGERRHHRLRPGRRLRAYRLPGPPDHQHLLRRPGHARRLDHRVRHRKAVQGPLAAARA
jgi:gluconolactonase